MKQKFRHRFNGKQYTITMETNLGQTKDGRKIYGYCTPPDESGRKIKLLSNISDYDLIEAAIHEALHACGFDVLDHDWVTKSSEDIAKFLLKLDIGKLPNV